MFFVKLISTEQIASAKEGVLKLPTHNHLNMSIQRLNTRTLQTFNKWFKRDIHRAHSGVRSMHFEQCELCERHAWVTYWTPGMSETPNLSPSPDRYNSLTVVRRYLSYEFISKYWH
jgi:hypothetical protein